MFASCLKPIFLLSKKKRKNEELPEPDISGVESGIAPDRKADDQPQDICT